MKFCVLHSIRRSRISINTRSIAFISSTSNRFSYIDADTDRYAHLLHKCANIKSLAEGKQIHTHLIKTALQQDIFLGNHAINMYSKCGVMEDACKLFDKMHQPNVLSWNTMISGYVSMASLEDAEQLFDKMPERDLVSWNAMLAGYSRHGHGDKAWRLFYQMKLAGTTPDQFTYSTVLSSCANSPPFEEGKQIHSQVIQTGFESNVYGLPDVEEFKTHADCSTKCL